MIDWNRYLRENPDVAQAQASGLADTTSPEQHFRLYGIDEGRKVYNTDGSAGADYVNGLRGVAKPEADISRLVATLQAQAAENKRQNDYQAYLATPDGSHALEMTNFAQSLAAGILDPRAIAQEFAKKGADTAQGINAAQEVAAYLMAINKDDIAQQFADAYNSTAVDKFKSDISAQAPKYTPVQRFNGAALASDWGAQWQQNPYLTKIFDEKFRGKGAEQEIGFMLGVTGGAFDDYVTALMQQDADAQVRAATPTPTGRVYQLQLANLSPATAVNAPAQLPATSTAPAALPPAQAQPAAPVTPTAAPATTQAAAPAVPQTQDGLKEAFARELTDYIAKAQASPSAPDYQALLSEALKYTYRAPVNETGYGEGNEQRLFDWTGGTTASVLKNPASPEAIKQAMGATYAAGPGAIQAVIDSLSVPGGLLFGLNPSDFAGTAPGTAGNNGGVDGSTAFALGSNNPFDPSFDLGNFLSGRQIGTYDAGGAELTGSKTGDRALSVAGFVPGPVGWLAGAANGALNVNRANDIMSQWGGAEDYGLLDFLGNRATGGLYSPMNNAIGRTHEANALGQGVWSPESIAAQIQAVNDSRPTDFTAPLAPVFSEPLAAPSAPSFDFSSMFSNALMPSLPAIPNLPTGFGVPSFDFEFAI